MHALSLSARGGRGQGAGDRRPSKPPLLALSQPFALVVAKVNRVLMRVYSLEKEKTTFSTGHVLDYSTYSTIPDRLTLLPLF